MSSKKRGGNLGDLITNASSDIQPIHRGAGLAGLFDTTGGPRLSAESHEPVGERDQIPDQHPRATAPARAGERAQPPSAPPTPHERLPLEARALRTPNKLRPARGQRGATTMPKVRASNAAAPVDRPKVPRQGKTFRLLPELARDIAVVAASRGMYEYIPIEEAVEQFLARRAAPAVTRPRDAAELARRVRKSYSLDAAIVRDIAVQSATWDVFEYEIVEEALRQYLDLHSV